MRSDRTVAALVGAVVSLAATQASAFCRTTTEGEASRDPDTGCASEGLPLYWRSQCVTYRLHERASIQISLSELDLIVKQSFAVWTNPGTLCLPSISAVALAPTADAEVGYDANGRDENLIVLRDDGWESDPASLGITTVTMDRETGEILDVDLEINTHDHVLPESDLRYVVTHELGHFLGLDHSMEPGAILSARYLPGRTTPPRLSEDDAAGICAIYPEGGERVTLDESGAELRIKATPCPPFAVDPGSAECGPGTVEHGCALGTSRRRTSGVFGAALVVLAGAALRARKRRRG